MLAALSILIISPILGTTNLQAVKRPVSSESQACRTALQHYLDLDLEGPTQNTAWADNRHLISRLKVVFNRKNGYLPCKVASAYALALTQRPNNKYIARLVYLVSSDYLGNENLAERLPISLQSIYDRTAAQIALVSLLKIRLDGAPAEVRGFAVGLEFNRKPEDVAKVWKTLDFKQRAEIVSGLRDSDISGTINRLKHVKQSSSLKKLIKEIG